MALLLRWRNGEDAAGNELVRRHFDGVFMFFFNKAPAVADDLTQKTFLGCHEAKARIREDGSFRAYLYGIARKQLLKYFEKAGRTVAMGDGPQGQSPTRESPSREVARHQEQRVLLQALRTLPLDLQIILELYYWEDMSVADVAAVVEIPAGTVKSRLHRAREALRAAIDALELSPELHRSTVENLDGWARKIRDRNG